MTKNRLVKTALCMVLAFAMTFAPIFSSYAMFANAMGENDTQTIESQEPSADESAQPADTASDGGAGDVTSEDAPADADTSEDQAEQAAGETEEALPEEAAKTEYVWEDEKIKVTARLSDASIIPDDAEFVVTPVNRDSLDYNYDAYMEALNKDSKIEHNESNTMLYDIAFIKDGVELQPESGKVSVAFEFLDKQLAETIGAKKAADVNVIHLPLTDEIKDKYDTTADAKKIESADINIQEVTKEENELKVSVKNEKVVFDLESFSILAINAEPLLAAAPENTVTAKLNFYDEAGTTLKAFAPKTPDQFALLVVIQDENNRYPAYALQTINPREQTSMDVNVSEFKSVTPITHDDGTITYEEGDSVTYTASAYPNVRVRLIHYPAGTVNSFDDIMKEDTTSSDTVEGYAFMGDNSPNPSSSSTNPATVNIKESFNTKEYVVRLTFDPEGADITPDDHYYIFVKREHTSGDITYYKEQITTSSSEKVKEYQIDEGEWMDGDGNTNSDVAKRNQTFTGQEKDLSVMIIKGAGDLNMNQLRTLTNCSAIADGGTVNVYTVDYPPTGSNWTERVKIEEDYERKHKDYVDIIKLTKNDVTNEYDYRTILGPGIGYGITADRLQQGGSDFQSNFAVNYGSIINFMGFRIADISNPA